MARLLVVEDEPMMLDSVRRGLEAEGYEVLSAETAEQGRQFCRSAEVDIVILDLMLSDEDGLVLLEGLRMNGFRQPVLIISARDTVNQRVAGLNCGADDYLVKPFSLVELLARVRVLLRRHAEKNETKLTFEDIVLDLVNRTVSRAGRAIELTPRQFDVLAYLMNHKNQIVSREMMAADIWRAETATWTKLIEVQINRLRNKLDTPGRKLPLHTIRGEGYLLGDRHS